MKIVNVFHWIGNPEENSVVCNTLAVETLALPEAVDNGTCLSKMLSDLLLNDIYLTPIEVMSNSKSLFDGLQSNKNVIEKYLQIVIALFNDFIDNKSITKIHYVPCKNQLANILTKKGASSGALSDTLLK